MGKMRFRLMAPLPRRPFLLFSGQVPLKRRIIGKQNLIGRRFVFMLAPVVARILFTDIRPLFVYGAGVILEMAAGNRNLYQPSAVMVNADFHGLVHKVPADILEIGLPFRFVDFKRYMAAAESVAGRAGWLPLYWFLWT
jgi:hypothetical protein